MSLCHINIVLALRLVLASCKAEKVGGTDLGNGSGTRKLAASVGVHREAPTKKNRAE